jgi:hypothetical protein
MNGTPNGAARAFATGKLQAARKKSRFSLAHPGWEV